jgi:hypothetical protein
MSHPVVLALFDESAAAAHAARSLRSLGVARERVSVVARSRDEEGILVEAGGASPGSEIEESLPASKLGELGAHVLAAVALVMPGIGPIVADGPLAVGMAEAAGHLAGDVSGALERAGMTGPEAQLWEDRIRAGAFLVGAHVGAADVAGARDVLTRAGAAELAVASWPE